MRDLFVSGIIFGSLPVILWRPWIGIIMWCWISYMNPHKLAWGFAYSMPFAMMVALATLLGMLLSREPKKFPWTRETVVLLLFLAWMPVTTALAFYPEQAWVAFDRVWKIQVMTFVTLILINSKQRLDAVIWTIVLSVGFFGVKGGLFTIAKGGAFHVYGPAASFIAGNNEIALALIMVIPLMRYLQLNTKRPVVHLGLGAAMLLSAIAAMGSQSRGALLAIIAMAFLFWIRSRGKLLSGLLICAAVAAIGLVMPAEWYARMATIESYEQDGSALGRINAWWFAWNLAKARPLVGGGFDTFQAPLFAVFAPEPYRVHDVHSIYFEVLGEHGFVGLTLFVLLGILAWGSASRIVKLVREHPEFKSYGDLARMLQASIVGYATGGAFLGLAYFDLYYHLVAAVVIARKLLENAIGQQAIGREEPLSRVPASSRSIAPLPNSSASASAMGRPGGATLRASRE